MLGLEIALGAGCRRLGGECCRFVPDFGGLRNPQERLSKGACHFGSKYGRDDESSVREESGNCQSKTLLEVNKLRPHRTFQRSLNVSYPTYIVCNKS